MRVRVPTRARHDRAASCGLAFDELGGPLVAVCGLVGGSGATTLALCLARQAAQESAVPVLLTELDSSRAGLPVLAGQATPLSLSELAQRVAGGHAPTEAFVEIEPGLRLVASAPRRASDTLDQDVHALLREAQAAHGLVVVDCGSAWDARGPVLEAATHIVWTVAASRTGLARARSLIGGDALPAPGRWREVLTAVAVEPRPGASVRGLRRLAAQRWERLVLAPHVDAVPRGQLAEAAVALGGALQGMAPILRSSQ